MASDLLAAIEAYWQANPALAAVGIPEFIGENTGALASYPYAIVSNYNENDPGETLEDVTATLTVTAFHTSLDALVAITTVIKDQLDSVAISPTAVRTVPFTWDGGRETGVIRQKSRAKRLRPGSGPNGSTAWREDIGYEFWAIRDT